jgi:Trp operon repressor
MERVNYNGSTTTKTTSSDVINKYPDRLIQLIDVVVEQRVLLTDINVNNLFIRCGSTRLDSCQMGVLDLDRKFVVDVTRFYWLSRITNMVYMKLAQQYMVFMVCFVGSNNGLTLETKRKLLHQVGLITDERDITTFKVGILNQMLSYDMLQRQIRHYLGFHADTYETTEAVSAEFMKHYIQGEPRTPGVRGKTMSMTPDSSSYGGGKSRRKYKPKPRKTRRKRSLHNQIR